MSFFIYCLYSTEDGKPRFIGHTESDVQHRLSEHITSALEHEPGALYDWFRELWRREAEVGVHALQEGVATEDLELFEAYWLGQFPKLLNPPEGGSAKEPGPVGQQVIAALRHQLKLSPEP